MNIDKQKKQKDPPEVDIKFILNLLSANKFIEAKKEINKHIINFPDSSILFNMLGAIFAEQKKLDMAVENYKKSIKINPNYAQAYNNLGIALHKLNKIDEAVENYNKAINLKNNFVEALNNLGNAMREKNRLNDALTFFKRAIKIKPDYAIAFNNLGATYDELGQKAESLKNFQEAIKIKPDYAEAYNNLGLAYNELKKFDESLVHYKKAISLKPDYEKSYNNLGNLLNDQGKFDEATTAFQTAIKIKPNYAKAYSNLLFNINCKTNFDPNLYLLEAKNFRTNCNPVKEKLTPKYQYKKEPKKLRIGIVSSDLGNHPGGYFTLSTLNELQKKDFELVAYSTFDRNDELSNQFKKLFYKWNSVQKNKDHEIAEQIYSDGIHILIDAQGHSSKNKLTIFFYKSAPIQITWLGQGSSGIREIDYFIGSSHITPKNEENHYVEKILRLPEISQCFTIPNFDIKINKLPAIKNKYVTFGSVNKLSKINDDVILLWSKILTSVPNSKLLLKNKNFDDEITLKKIIEKFSNNNINKNRLILIGESDSRKELLKVYNDIDISLDPFPFQGNTSTCESVWMGVPVLVLKGNRYLFHFGESINSNLGMLDWIAKDYEEYISIAVKFSSDLNALSRIRMTLRNKALKSPVFDATRFSEHFGKLLWDIWKKFTN